MTDNNGNDGGGSATTVLVTVIIIVIIGLAFYFGFVRGNWGGNKGDTNIEVTLPTGNSDEGATQ